ncbi:MAG: MBL fold metallo-hydrolase [Halobacteriales archaeon]
MAERLAPGLHLLDLGWAAPLGANAYLVDDGEITLVDAGFPLNATRVREEIRAAGVAVADVDRVLLTHYDLDHVGGLSRLVPDLEAPVYLGDLDLRLLRGEWDPPALHHKGLFHRGLRRLHRLPDSLELHPVHDGDEVGGFRAFHTPGHNPGHTVYVHAGLGAAMLGDLVWAEDGGLTTPVLLDSYDLATIRNSVRRFAAEAPPFEMACVAHGRPLLADGDDALRALADRLPADAPAEY